jgi:hypothetical protein
MERAVEWFVAVTSFVIGASHILRSGDWAEAYRQLHRCGRPGAFANGALSLMVGAAVVAGHSSWAWPGAVLTAFARSRGSRSSLWASLLRRPGRKLAVGGRAAGRIFAAGAHIG